MDQISRSSAHAEFVKQYEHYLDVVYPDRDSLADIIGEALAERGVRRILDCAAGTGFPSLDLADDPEERFEVHCCDGDRLMLARLVYLTRRRHLPVRSLIPPRRSGPPSATSLSGLVVEWGELSQLESSYDAVICRGNALAYADTWTGRRTIAPRHVIDGYLAGMADRVRSGGSLYIDAPWNLEMATVKRPPFVETVDREGGRRRWQFSFPDSDGQMRTVWRYSSLLTIDLVRKALDGLGFTETDPFQLEGRTGHRRHDHRSQARVMGAPGAWTKWDQYDISLV